MVVVIGGMYLGNDLFYFCYCLKNKTSSQGVFYARLCD